VAGGGFVSTTRLPDLRLHDLIRHQRGPLHDAGLITDAEYAALAADHGAVARLEGYDALRAENDRLRAALTERTTERDDARRMLAECYVLSGADTDGNTVESGWEHLWRDAVAEVRTLREGYDEAVDGPAVHPSDCQSCSEDPGPCRTHAEDWRYWRARALDFEEGASVEAREADRGREEVARLRAAFGMDSPWPLLDVLARLADAADHLHTDHNCDTHGWETVRAAAEHARVYVDRLRAALLPSPPAQTEETP
jgi:hypothetical protein